MFYNLLSGLSTNQWVALFTLGLVFLTAIQVLIYVLMLRTTHRVERGYLHAKHVAVFENFAIGQKPIIAVMFVNGGKTPLRVVKSGGALVVVDAVKPIANGIPLKRKALARTSMYFVPSMEQAFVPTCSNVITESEFKNVIAGRGRLWVYVRLQYVDQFQWKWTGRTHFINATFEFLPALEAVRKAQGRRTPAFKIAPGAPQDGN